MAAVGAAGLLGGVNRIATASTVIVVRKCHLPELGRFEDDEAVTMAVNAWIEERHQNFVLEGLKTLEQRWEICVALRGNYVEKQ